MKRLLNNKFNIIKIGIKKSIPNSTKPLLKLFVPSLLLSQSVPCTGLVLTVDIYVECAFL